MPVVGEGRGGKGRRDKVRGEGGMNDGPGEVGGVRGDEGGSTRGIGVKEGEGEEKVEGGWWRREVWGKGQY